MRRVNAGGGASMKYQDCIQPAQAPGGSAAGERLADANINAATGLATDYLNHFNEAIMLLEMLPSCPDCVQDFLAWRPLSYREHFAGSQFRGRELAIAAYEAADPALRARLDAFATAMTAMLQATGTALRSGLPPDAGGLIAEAVAAGLKPLVARAGALINGEGEAEAEPDQTSAPQAVVDGLMQRSA
jgi:hypothetical protein